MEFKGILKAWPAFGIVLGKMVLAPVIVYHALLLLSSFIYIPAAVIPAMTLISCLPSMSTFPIMAKENGSEAAEYATQAVVITTVCSLVTIPFIAWLL